MEHQKDQVKLLLLDKQHFFREGVRAILNGEADLLIEHEAHSLSDAIYPGGSPDVSIVDPFIGEGAQNGVDLLDRLIRLYPESRVLVLSHMDNPEIIRRCLSAGACGYVHKAASAEDLVAAVRKVAAGEDYLHPSLGARLIRRIPVKAAGPELTHTEKAMLSVLARGHTNAEAASILCYSVRTVEAYRSRLMKKLNLQNRAHLVKIAAELDLLHFNAPDGQFTHGEEEAV